MLKSLVMMAMLTGASALAQTVVETPPPMVPAPPPPMPASDPSAPPMVQPGTPAAAPATSAQLGTPPPPSMLPPSYVPGSQASQPGYQYSPYGQPQSKEKPGPEVGLMLSESLFGMLTAAGITILPYFLLFNGSNIFGSGDSTLSSVLFILIFSAAPLAVAQTEVGLANGSRYWFTETWPAAVAGLAAEAAVLGLYYLTGWLPQIVDSVTGVPPKGAACSTDQNSGLQTCGGSLPLLLIGAIGVVPLIQMAVINLFKQPKYKPYVMNDDGPPRKPGMGVTLAPPSAAPIFSAPDGSAATGVSISLLRGTW